MISKTKQIYSLVITFTCASVIFNPLANCERSDDAKYFCRWKRFSNSYEKKKKISIEIQSMRSFINLREFVNE